MRVLGGRVKLRDVSSNLPITACRELRVPLRPGGAGTLGSANIFAGPARRINKRLKGIRGIVVTAVLIGGDARGHDDFGAISAAAQRRGGDKCRGGRHRTGEGYVD